MSTQTSTKPGWYQPSPMGTALGANNQDFQLPVKTNRTERVIGWTMCMIDRTQQPFHSSLERLFIHTIALDPRCIAFKAQPEQIIYADADGSRRYTPDAYLTFSSGHRVMAEVKSEADFRSPENAARWPYIRKAAEQMGMRFAWFGKQWLTQPQRLANITYLNLYRSSTPDLETAHLIDQAFARKRAYTMHELQTIGDDPLLTRDTVSSLIIERRLTTDLNSPYDANSVIRRVE